MKKLIAALAVVALVRCNNSETNNENPTAIDDSTQHPNGVTSDRVISTDTSQFDVPVINQDSARQERIKNK